MGEAIRRGSDSSRKCLRLWSDVSGPPRNGVVCRCLSVCARVWPGGPIAFDLHQYTSLLGLAFALFHALVLLGDHYIGYSLAKILMPFSSTAYKPLEVGLGQIALYLLALVGLSFYTRALIGRKLWRSIHFLSFALFIMALLHGVGSGTDSATPFALIFYWLTGGTVLFATVYRVLVVLPSPARA